MKDNVHRVLSDLWSFNVHRVASINPLTPTVAAWVNLQLYWLIVHGLTFPPTQYRLYGRVTVLQVKRHNQQYQSTEGTQPAIEQPVQDRIPPSFLIFDILALRRLGLSVQLYSYGNRGRQWVIIPGGS